MGIVRMRHGGLLCAAALASATLPVVAQAEEGAAEAVASVYLPADFARFAPRNALDMLGQVPGFDIRGEDDQRGLGQASGNVLIDGERVSSKAEGLFDRLRRITANRVERIEIVDGATLGIAGLSGPVANVITRPAAISGRYEYRANARPHYADPSYFGGEVSLSGTSGNLEWSTALTHSVGRGAAGGPDAVVFDPSGNVRENRDVALHFNGDFPQASGRISWQAAEGVTLNLNASYTRRFSHFSDDELRMPVSGVDLFRDFDNRDRGYLYEIGGDLTVPLAGGSLKLVGLDRTNHNRGRADAVLTPADGSPAFGNRFTSLTDSGERIARAEYSWNMLGGGWQLDGEAAFNRLHQTAALFDLDPSGQLVEVPFPNASGGVTEDRYEVILTHNRQLAGNLTMQLGGGAEFSTLAQTGPAGLTRHFQRPKGSLSLAWTPSQGRDVSLRLSRSVGQLSFGDFLASVSLSQDNQNAGNVRLVPAQYWEASAELRESLGPWGSTRVKLFQRWYEDFIEFIPVPGGLETRGNLPHARATGLDWTNTLELRQVGFNGARLNTTLNLVETRLADPLTGEHRAFSGQNDVHAEIGIRHDVPSSHWAWGTGVQYNHNMRQYRLAEVIRDWEGPIYTYAFVENKDVLGMTANFQVFNLTNGRARFDRTVYDGYRDSSPVLFTERRNLSVQMIFQFRLTGTF